MTKLDVYPEWMGKKQGKLIFSEADWPATIGFKWGTFVTGAGTVTKDSDHGQGGGGAVKLTTGVLTDDVSEIKHSCPYYVGDGKIAFEMKFALQSPAFGASTFDFGIEPRTVEHGFMQGRMQFLVSSDEWKYESAQDVYTAFSDPVIIHEPTADAAAALAGDQFGWARLVIDVDKREYVSFEAAGKGKIEFRSMLGIPLVDRGVTTDNILLFFALGTTASTGAEDYFTTDWAATVLN